jgi:hypothetical protein
MNQTIEITIDTKGQATVQTKGFAGTSCREGSNFIEQALGEVQTDQPTAEMYQSVDASQRIEQR